MKELSVCTSIIGGLWESGICAEVYSANISRAHNIRRRPFGLVTHCVVSLQLNTHSGQKIQLIIHA